MPGRRPRRRLRPEEKLGYSVEQRFNVHGTDFVFLAAGSSRLELMAYASEKPEPATGLTASMNPARLHHMCLRVDDLSAALDELAANGVECIGGPTQVDDIQQRFAFVADNLGNIIELTQTV